MRIETIKAYSSLSDEIHYFVKMLRVSLASYFRRHGEIDNILVTIIVKDAVVAELLICRKSVEDIHEKALLSFENWIDRSRWGARASKKFFTRYASYQKNLFLVYFFEQQIGVLHEFQTIGVDELVEKGTRVYDVIQRMGKDCRALCPDCGAKNHYLHKLGCRFEQCACCDGLLASCLCGCSEVPFGWYIIENGSIPADDMRIPFGDESYSFMVLDMFFDGIFGMSS